MSLTSTLEGLVGTYGAPALFATVGLETLGLPLPGESAILLASGLAGTGEGDIRAVAAAAFLGSVLGDNLAFAIGRRLGRPAIVRLGSRVGITDARFARVEALMRRHGALIVVTARFFVVLRQLNGLVAGAAGMRWPTFVLANMVGAGLWVGVWTTMGYRFGASTEIVPFIVHHLALLMGIAIPAAIVLGVVLHLRHRPGSRRGR